MDRDFVERRDESFYPVGSRVPLASIVREFQDGQSPEPIPFSVSDVDSRAGLRRHHPFTWDTGPRSTRTSRLVNARRMRSARRIPLPLI
jgi:hypothetical protein